MLFIKITQNTLDNTGDKFLIKFPYLLPYPTYMRGRTFYNLKKEKGGLNWYLT